MPIDGMYGVFTPEDYFLISQSSRAINADFNGGGGANGTDCHRHCSASGRYSHPDV